MIPKIGQIATITKIADSTMPDYLLGLTGQVVHYDYACGCGQSYPDDPMIGVKIQGEVFEFWKEELSF
jgi:hypothetical protein